MMDFNERVIPGVSANFLFQEALARYEFAQKLIKNGVKVLDVGCGTGYGSALLGQKARVFAIDRNQEAIDFCRRKYGKRAHFRLGTAEELFFKDKEFDVVCAFEIIEHLGHPRKFLSEVKRILKDDGKFFLSTPNQIRSQSLRSPYHLQEYTYSEIFKLLNGFFSEIKIFGQKKSAKATLAFKDFMESQKARESLVRSDRLGLRKLIPPEKREKLWKFLGNFSGRHSQEALTTKDFPISLKNPKTADYFMVICQP